MSVPRTPLGRAAVWPRWAAVALLGLVTLVCLPGRASASAAGHAPGPAVRAAADRQVWCPVDDHSGHGGCATPPHSSPQAPRPGDDPAPEPPATVHDWPRPAAAPATPPTRTAAGASGPDLHQLQVMRI